MVGCRVAGAAGLVRVANRVNMHEAAFGQGEIDLLGWRGERSGVGDRLWAGEAVRTSASGVRVVGLRAGGCGRLAMLGAVALEDAWEGREVVEWDRKAVQ